MTIRSLLSHDIKTILAIQSVCPEIAQWTMRDYASVARGGMAGWVAEKGSGAVGFLVARQVLSDLEVLNFAVLLDSRRQGIGTELLRAALEWGASFHAERVILEVRASNAAALRFYERHNFRVTGRRPRYYAAPIEDALQLTCTLAQASAGDTDAGR